MDLGTGDEVFDDEHHEISHCLVMGKGFEHGRMEIRIRHDESLIGFPRLVGLRDIIVWMIGCGIPHDSAFFTHSGRSC